MLLSSSSFLDVGAVPRPSPNSFRFGDVASSMAVVWILHSLSTVDGYARRSTRHFKRFIGHGNHLLGAATLAAV